MKTFLRFAFYHVLCPFLLFIRIDRLLQIRSGNRKLIVMYHGVSRNNAGAINGRHLPVEQFEEHLRYFRKNFQIVPLAELCEMKSNGDKKHTIALTFDDGYRNNLENALPLLEKYQIPATFFISSEGLVENDYIHPSDYLDLINNSFSDEGIEISGARFRKGKYHLVDERDGKSGVYQFINSMKLPAFRAAFSRLRQRYPIGEITAGVKGEFYQVIRRSEIGKLRDSGLITIGSHSHSHVSLTCLSEHEIRSQLQTSKDIFIACGVDSWYYLAYPYGSFNDNVLSISRELRYRFLIAGGRVDPRYSSQVFPRIGISNLASFAFNMLLLNRAFRRFGF